VRHLCEPQGRTEGLLKMCDGEQARVPDESEFQAEEATMLKAMAVWTWETDNRLVLEKRRKRAVIW